MRTVPPKLLDNDHCSTHELLEVTKGEERTALDGTAVKSCCAMSAPTYKSGKKVRGLNPRRSLDAEAQVLRTIEAFAEMGAITVGGYFDQGVIESWYLENCYDLHHPEGDEVWDFEQDAWVSLDPLPTGDKIAAPLTAIFGDNVRKVFKPKRWFDTTPRFRKCMLLYGVRGDPATHRPLTIWIGKEMIETSRATGKPLAAMLHKRLSDRLRRLLGVGNFGMWLNVESSDKAPYALHGHGLLYVKDARYLVDDSKERDTLIRELMDGSDYDKSMHAPNWVRITAKDLNTGWIDYSRKARRGRLFRVSATEPPKDIGDRLEAGTHELRRQASDFYARARIMFTGLAKEEILDWTDDDWKRVTGPTFPGL
jgi:hypothetical protein